MKVWEAVVLRLMQATMAGPIWSELELPEALPVEMSQYSLTLATPPAMTLSAMAPTFERAPESPFQT
jgi:hypothetical protein